MIVHLHGATVLCGRRSGMSVPATDRAAKGNGTCRKCVRMYEYARRDGQLEQLMAGAPFRLNGGRLEKLESNNG